MMSAERVRLWLNASQSKNAYLNLAVLFKIIKRENISFVFCKLHSNPFYFFKLIFFFFCNNCTVILHKISL